MVPSHEPMSLRMQLHRGSGYHGLLMKPGRIHTSGQGSQRADSLSHSVLDQGTCGGGLQIALERCMLRLLEVDAYIL